MLIASMNQQASPDVLVVILAADTAEQSVETKQNITRIYNPADGQTLGYNFLEASQIDETLVGNGQINLNETQVTALKQALSKAGFDDSVLVIDQDPKFVVGYVESATKHPDSDHLLVTKTRVDNDHTLQIVSGSPNMKTDIYVVVAKVGAMMPNGEIIWPGELRGVPSNGMITSGRELQLANAPQKKGALILPDNFGKVGDAFDFERGNKLFV